MTKKMNLKWPIFVLSAQMLTQHWLLPKSAGLAARDLMAPKILARAQTSFNVTQNPFNNPQNYSQPPRKDKYLISRNITGNIRSID
jgi:hypothetical protein